MHINLILILKLLLLSACLQLGAVSISQAAIIQATYQVTAGDFLDSSFNPPPPPATTFVSGTVTFTFDTAIPTQIEITPDTVNGFDITDRNGVLHDYDETNSGINTALDTFNNWRRITFGGNESSVAVIVGLSNDFRLQWDINLNNYEVISVFENFTYISTVDPIYYAGFTTVELVSATVVPIGPAAPFFLLGAAMLGIVSFRRKSH